MQDRGYLNTALQRLFEPEGVQFHLHAAVDVESIAQILQRLLQAEPVEGGGGHVVADAAKLPGGIVQQTGHFPVLRGLFGLHIGHLGLQLAELVLDGAEQVAHMVVQFLAHAFALLLLAFEHGVDALHLLLAEELVHLFIVQLFLLFR